MASIEEINEAIPTDAVRLFIELVNISKSKSYSLTLNTMGVMGSETLFVWLKDQPNQNRHNAKLTSEDIWEGFISHGLLNPGPMGTAIITQEGLDFYTWHQQQNVKY